MVTETTEPLQPEKQNQNTVRRIETSTPRPAKKQKIDKVDEAAASAIKTATEVMSTVCKSLDNRTTRNQQVLHDQPSNEVRAFCDMLYYQLSGFEGKIWKIFSSR